jgi:hypothetical protein
MRQRHPVTPNSALQYARTELSANATALGSPGGHPETRNLTSSVVARGLARHELTGVLEPRELVASEPGSPNPRDRTWSQDQMSELQNTTSHQASDACPELTHHSSVSPV